MNNHRRLRRADGRSLAAAARPPASRRRRSRGWSGHRIAAAGAVDKSGCNWFATDFPGSRSISGASPGSSPSTVRSTCCVTAVWCAAWSAPAATSPHSEPELEPAQPVTPRTLAACSAGRRSRMRRWRQAAGPSICCNSPRRGDCAVFDPMTQGPVRGIAWAHGSRAPPYDRRRADQGGHDRGRSGGASLVTLSGKCTLRLESGDVCITLDRHYAARLAA